MIRARFYTLLLVAVTPVAASDSEVTLKGLPDFYSGGWEYKVDPYIRAAVSLQSLGKEKASTKLLELAKANREDLYESQKVVVLCRMLFSARTRNKFRRPMIGGAVFLGGTGYSDWPLEPIECVGGVPFLVAAGYMLAGQAEPSESYVQYCMTNCLWSTYRWRVPSDGEKRAALAKLLSSRKWKKPLKERDRRFLSAQIEDAK